MADKRSATIKSFGFRQTATGGVTTTFLVGEELAIEQAANDIPMADGTPERAGSAVRITVPIYDPALFAALDTLQENAEELEITINFWEGPDNTAIYDPVGFTVTPLENGESGNLEGLMLDCFILGLTDADYLTLSEAL